MNKIKILPENLINQISAGEVIERPANIVKELVENSIDAGSSKIEIEISNECKNIRISDNGTGINRDDIELAFSRHATSKISKISDLWGLSTLGFRGEALASIISISKLTCTSRTQDSSSGIKAECRNSKISLSETGCAVGTTMEIKELFYNVPARLKFLKSPRAEMSHILELAQSLAISRPEMAFQLINNGKSLLKTSGSADISVAVSEIYGGNILKELLQISNSDESENLSAEGYISSPEFTRSNKKAIYLFVNGRVVKCPIMLKSVDTACKDIIPSGRYPFVVLKINLPADKIDVNVHPTKKEIRYTNPNLVFNFILTSIKSALEPCGKYYLPFSDASDADIRALNEDVKSFKPDVNNETIPFNERKNYGFHFPSSYSSAKTEVYEKSLEFYEPIAQSQLELADLTTDLKKFKIIGQLFESFILVETQEGLMIIDQHIAHERVIFENLKNQRDFTSQLFLDCSGINIEPSELVLIEENSDLLSKYGWEFAFEKPRTVFIKKAPIILASQDRERLINDILEDLKGSIEDIENKILISMSCKAAIKANHKLSLSEMETLINDWQKAPNNRTCPHGRVIAHVIPSKEIANFFARQDFVKKT